MFTLTLMIAHALALALSWAMLPVGVGWVAWYAWKSVVLFTLSLSAALI
jgi:hypothetical protein